MHTQPIVKVAGLCAACCAHGESVTSVASDHTIGHWGVGALSGFTFDLVRGKSSALFFGPELDALLIPHKILVPRTLYFGASMSLGARF